MPADTRRVLAGALVVMLGLRGRLLPRPVPNVRFGLLLQSLLVTAGLGIVRVANLHLPVFDGHCLFGRALPLLLAVHLGFTLRAVWRSWPARVTRRPERGRCSSPRPCTAAAATSTASAAAATSRAAWAGWSARVRQQFTRDHD